MTNKQLMQKLLLEDPDALIFDGEMRELTDVQAISGGVAGSTFVELVFQSALPVGPDFPRQPRCGETKGK